MNLRLFLLLSGLFSVTAFGQSQDSLLQVLQHQIRELKIQRSQDSLKVNVLSQELQSLLLLDIRRVDTEKDSIYKAQRQEEIKRIYSKANGSPLVLENDTLYTVYASLGLYSLKIKSQNDLLMVTYQGEWIQAVSEEDAILAHLSQEELAQSLQRDILRAVTQYRIEHSMQKRLMRIGELFLFVIAIITLFYLLNLLFRKLEQQLLKQSFFKKGLKLKNYQMLNKENMKYILLP